MWREKALDPGQAAEPRLSEDNARTDDVYGRTIMQALGWWQPREARTGWGHHHPWLGKCQLGLPSSLFTGEPAPGWAAAQFRALTRELGVFFLTRDNLAPTLFALRYQTEWKYFCFTGQDDSCAPPPGGCLILLRLHRLHRLVTCFRGWEENSGSTSLPHDSTPRHRQPPDTPRHGPHMPGKELSFLFHAMGKLEALHS